jgi:hypothetical protein
MTVPAWLGWLLLVVPCGAAPVCKCGVLAVEDQVARAEAVFSGTVLHVEEHFVPPVVAPPERVGPDSSGAIRARGSGGIPGRASALAVTRGWKGAGAGERVVVHELLICPQLFQDGGEYLVYAVRDEHGRLVTSRCERTRPLHEVPDDVRRLDSLAVHRGS